MKGKDIGILPDSGARYTSSKVRSAIFDGLGGVEGLRVLDLFAGSGSFSLEALSRGAQSAACVEKDRRMFDLLKDNFRRLSLTERAVLLNMDVESALPFLQTKGRIYDIIFADPPYERGFITKTTGLLTLHTVHHQESLIIMQHSKRETMDAALTRGYFDVKVKHYGDTMVTIMRPERQE